ncbi:prenyltransferase/squalene oxidase repeat-containing protein [Frankia nepalensis]
MQEPDGAIPWFPGGHTDAWDHLECAMALELGGREDAAQRAWEWLVRNQRPDGSWATSYIGGGVKEDFADSNQCAYVATAVWHRWRRTGDRAFVSRMWPVVRAALDFVVDLQAPSGQIWWARSADGQEYPAALVTGCASTLHSLRCGLGLAALVGESQPGWELAIGAVAHALRTHPEYFLVKDRWSMDWYYPVIGGALRGEEGLAHLRTRWDDFVVDGLGIRCVDDQPWATGAETCELAIAMHLVGETAAARTLVNDMQHLRHHDGAYWTGWQFETGCHWPVERSTWTAAAVILAVDVLAGGVSEAVFRGDDLPEPLTILEPAGNASGLPAGAIPGDRVAPRPRDPDQLELGCDCEPAPLLAAWARGPLADRLSNAL